MITTPHTQAKPSKRSTVNEPVNKPMASLTADEPTHRLEDVVDHVQYRVAGNGISVTLVRTVAWSMDKLFWRLEGPVPLQPCGVLCAPQVPLELQCELFDEHGAWLSQARRILGILEDEGLTRRTGIPQQKGAPRQAHNDEVCKREDAGCLVVRVPRLLDEFLGGHCHVQLALNIEEGYQI